MNRIFFLPANLLLLFILLTSCDQDNENDMPDIPEEGMYVSTQFTKSQITLLENVAYGTRPNFQHLQYTSEKTKTTEIDQDELTLTLDIYTPPNATSSSRQPLLVMIHGGGFSEGDKDAWANEAYTYAGAGYICATLNYRLTKGGGNDSPELRLFAVQCSLEDIQNAIRYLKVSADKYFIDDERIVVFGGSAGGALSLLNAIEANTTTGINDFPGVSSKTSGSISTGATLVNDDPATALGSVVYDAQDSPVLMFHAKEYDSSTEATWTDNAVPTQEAIINSGNICTLIAQPNMTHTVVLTLGGDYWPDLKPFLWDNLPLAGL